MKHLKQFFAAMVLIAVSFCAWAGPTAKDVEAAMRAGNWQGAEQMLNQVLAKKPNSAKAHYLLAQTYEQTGKLSQARNELQLAKNYDPSLKFASSGAIRKMESRLGMTVQEKRYAAPVVAATAEPLTTASMGPPVVNQNAGQSSGGFGIILVTLLILGALGFGIYYWMKQRAQAQAKKQAAQDFEDQKRATLARAIDAHARAAEAQKTLKYESQSGSQLGQEVTKVASQIVDLVSNLKVCGCMDELRSYSVALQRSTTKLGELEVRLQARDFDNSAHIAAEQRRQAKEFVERQKRAEQDRIDSEKRSRERAIREANRREEERREREDYELRRRNTPQQTVHHHHTTVVDNRSDAFTAAILASAMTNSQASNSRDDDDDWNSRKPAYEAPAPSKAPELDFGGSSSWDNDDESKKSTGSSYGSDSPNDPPSSSSDGF